MKAKLISAAIAAVCANGAFALTPASLPANLEVFIAGASAQDNGLKQVLNSLCTDTVHSYSEGTSAPGKDYTAYFCTMGATAGLPAGTKVLIHKRSKGGSAFGAAPVEARASIERLVVANDATCTQVGSTTHYTCTGRTNSIPDAGITDVEPGLFRGVNLLASGAGSAPMSAAQLAKLDKKPVAALGFGPVVTTGLRNALQAAQGLTVGSDDEAQMPTLTKAQYASLVAGAVQTWDQFQGLDTSSLSDTTVNVCRRTSGSGTQAVSNLKFLNQPCSSNVVPASDNTADTGLGGTGDFTPFEQPAIHENESSGNVDTCMQNVNAAGQWAVGFQSLEKTGDSGTSLFAYRFVKVDGVSPLLSNIAKGKYDVFGITSFQWIKSPNTGTPTGTKLTLLNKIRNDLGNPAELRTSNLTFKGANITGGIGKVGFAALASNGFTALPFAETTPVIPLSNRGLGATGEANSCSATVLSQPNSAL